MKLQGFTGETARIAQHLLPPNASSYTNNVEFIRGTLKPTKQPLQVITNPFGNGTAPTVKTLYRTAAGKYIAWPGDVNVVRSTTPDDGLERIYWTGEGAPKMASVTNIVAGMGGAMMAFVPSGLTIALGVAAPAASIAATPAGSGSGTPAIRQYVYTWVTTYGEESAPSTPSAGVTVLPGQTATVTITSSTAPTNTTALRIYRTDANGTYRYVMQWSLGTWTGSDTVDDLFLGEALATAGWAKPNTGLTGLKAGPNGVLCGFFGNTVCFSEPYAPYAWPVAYQFNTDYPIVAVQANAGGWLIMTTATPYFIQGEYPGQMTMARINQTTACVSVTSVVDMGDYIIYAAPTGLVAARGMDIKLMTWDAVTRDQWQVSSPTSVRGYAWEGRYVGFLNAGTTTNFVFYPDGNYFAQGGYGYTAAVLDPQTGNLFTYVASDGKIRQWNAGVTDTLTWRSKRFVFNQPTNIGAIMIDADWGTDIPPTPVTFNLYADGALTYTATASIGDSQPHKLPGNYMANSFIAEIISTHEIYSISFGRDMQELTES